MSPIGTNTVTLSDFHESVARNAIDAELREPERTQPDYREDDRAPQQNLARCLHQARLPGSRRLEPTSRPLDARPPPTRHAPRRRGTRARSSSRPSVDEVLEQESARPHWLTPGVRGIGIASLLADLGHEVPTALLPSLLTSTLGAPASALGLIEGVSDGLAGAARFAGGPLADDPQRRRPVAVAGYTSTAVLLGDPNAPPRARGSATLLKREPHPYQVEP